MSFQLTQLFDLEDDCTTEHGPVLPRAS
jgi:hypothetical protein